MDDLVSRALPSTVRKILFKRKLSREFSLPLLVLCTRFLKRVFLCNLPLTCIFRVQSCTSTPDNDGKITTHGISGIPLGWAFLFASFVHILLLREQHPGNLGVLKLYPTGISSSENWRSPLNSQAMPTRVASSVDNVVDLKRM